MDKEQEEISKKRIIQCGIKANLFFYVEGETESQIQQRMERMIDLLLYLRGERGVIAMKGKFEEPVKGEEVFTTVGEFTLFMNSLEDLHQLAFQFNPMSFEILKMNMTEAEVLGMLNYASIAGGELKRRMSEAQREEYRRKKQLMIDRHWWGDVNYLVKEEDLRPRD